MNNSYFSSPPSFEYSSPSISTYYYSPTFTPCPVHASYPFYASPTQLENTSPSPSPYSYYQQPTQVFTPRAQQNTFVPTCNADRTPLRRHQCFKKNELEVLHQIYLQSAYPSLDVLQELAAQLNVSIEKVRQWFKNRRHSDKQKKRTTART